ncbi:MAG: Transcriptional regulator, LysR family [Chthoniobacteraceae bacterium]|nr:Transcriptional regulator, LysR family [Chthoniobacteraceae bacterium]
MDLRQLRYFQAVAEELSYSRAAERLRIAQPALSRAVQEVEAELGAPLLDRDRRSVSLTPAGRVLLREASILFERWDEAMRRVRRTAAGEEGELRIGYIGPPTQPFLGRLLKEYRLRYPLVSIHLEERTPERVWEMLAKGRLSIAFTRPVSSTGTSDLRTLLLRKERLGVVLSNTHPLAGRATLSWRQLAGEPLIVLARREGVGLHDAVLAGCQQAKFSPRIAYTPSLIGTVLSYVEAGAGLGIVPESVGTPDATLRFIPLKPVVSVPLVLAWQEGEEMPATQRLRELVTSWQVEGKLWKL